MLAIIDRLKLMVLCVHTLVGSDATSTALDNGKCGTSNTPTHYSTSQRHAYIVMVTDASIQRAGFKLEYLAAKDYCKFHEYDKFKVFLIIELTMSRRVMNL